MLILIVGYATTKTLAVILSDALFAKMDSTNLLTATPAYAAVLAALISAGALAAIPH